VARSPRAETLILDIETIPDVERWQRPEPPAGLAEGPPVPPPRSDVFPPIWAHRIIVVGCLQLDHGYGLRKLEVIDAPRGGTPDERERAVLMQLTERMTRERPTLVTYNGRSFDLPVIAMRSLCHAVPLGWYYRDRDVRARYSGAGHLDLCDWLADHGAIRAGKLDQIARLIGLPGKVGIDGSQVDGLFARGELAAIENYCLADCAQTALLFLRFQLLRGSISLADYRARTGELVEALAQDGRVNDVLEGLDRARLLGPTEPAAPFGNAPP
jgi:predicted PolB exonuclease-like 3'-5' exonuclease